MALKGLCYEKKKKSARKNLPRIAFILPTRNEVNFRKDGSMAVIQNPGSIPNTELGGVPKGSRIGLTRGIFGVKKGKSQDQGER